MKLPRRLDREKRIHDLSVLLKEKTEASTMWFRQFRNTSAKLSAARGEIAALKRQVASTQLRLGESMQETARLRDELDRYEQGVPS